MKRWRKVLWTFLVAAICFVAFGIWVVKSRSGLVFEKDTYYKQRLINTPYVTKIIDPDYKYVDCWQVKEVGTLKGLAKEHAESNSVFGDLTETWRGPCYVEVQVGDERRIIWGKKLVKVEYQPLHSVQLTIE